MKDRGIRSYSELAQVSGLHRNTIQHLLKSSSVLPASLERILLILKIPLHEALVDQASPQEESRENLISSIVDQLHDAFPDVTFVLFGSRARGQARKYSDVDLGVFSKKELPHETFRKIFRMKCELEESAPIFVDLINLNTATDDFLASISKDWSFLTGRRGDWAELKRRIEPHER